MTTRSSNVVSVKSKMGREVFRAELKRLEIGQSAFAALTGTPLRTVQSWALGERALPRNIKSLFAKVEAMPRKEQLLAGLKEDVKRLTVPQQEGLLKLALQFKKDHEKEQAQDNKILEQHKQIGELRKQVGTLSGQIDEVTTKMAEVEKHSNHVNRVCATQSVQLENFRVELARRVANATVFNQS
ncbi:helix-turn-helix domain-containing protein [Lichenicoccus roseus]|uniref:Uncharacterized protein n=1 Tax=Lichenicoccus roseus TaxID=2683649 RepID=A0A5R9J158_9PROT|nr:hypothetical protein [Lichenicoccus roseus]TLU71272.1 hypothetical protein FE263_17365 [Lichenicoccus roseus]